MTPSRSRKPIQQSCLDRLIAPDTSVAPDRAQSIELLKESVRRDLEWLLNTRRNPTPVPDNCEQLNTSVFQYGLPDLTSFGLNSTKDRNRLLTILDSTVATFEPRLQDVRVTFQEAASHSRVMRFTIHATLRTDPAPERVSFDTVLQLNSGEYKVQGNSSGR